MKTGLWLLFILVPGLGVCQTTKSVEYEVYGKDTIYESGLQDELGKQGEWTRVRKKSDGSEILISLMVYRNDQLHGWEICYFENGVKSSEILYSRGKRKHSLYYYETGELSCREKPTGKRKLHLTYYYDNGQVKSIGKKIMSFKRDEKLEDFNLWTKVGKWRYFYDNGALEDIEFFPRIRNKRK